MSQFWTRTIHRIDKLSEWSGRIVAVLFFICLGIMMYEVISRYVFNRPTNWGLEATTMFFGPFALGSGAYALLHGAHVKMDIFYNRWSKKTRAVVDALTFPLFLFLCGLIIWKSAIYGWESCLIREHSNTAWAPPIYYWKLTVPLAALLLTFQGISNFIRNLIFIVSGEETL